MELGYGTFAEGAAYGWAAIALGIGSHSSLWSPYVIGQTIYIYGRPM